MPSKFNDAKTALSELTKALREVHRCLVEVARNEYERESGPVNDAGQLLQLLTKHPQFDWLHQLSEFIVDVDELLDHEMVPEAEMRSILTQAKLLMAPSASDTSEFSQRYLALLQRDPALVMAHANVRRLLSAT
jgi:hypothetical protein